MKIRIFIPFILVVAILLAGCGSSGSPTEDTELVGIALCANEDWPEYPVAKKLEERLNETGKFRVDLENGSGQDYGGKQCTRYRDNLCRGRRRE